ncbi:MAG: hypothetical protein PHU53_04385 [Thermoplasmata archaeon]|nr:hypothetical protein [Thermoplasmata archaeon]
MPELRNVFRPSFFFILAALARAVKKKFIKQKHALACSLGIVMQMQREG